MHRLQDVGVASLDGRRLADQVDGNLDRDLLFQADLIKVNVDRTQAPRVGLNLADQDLFGAIPVNYQVDQVSAPRLDEHLLKLEAVHHKGGRGSVVAVDDTGKLALAVETAGTLAEERAGGGFQLHGWASGWRGVVMIPRTAIRANRHRYQEV